MTQSFIASEAYLLTLPRIPLLFRQALVVAIRSGFRQILGTLPQQASGFAIRRPHDGAAGRVLRLATDAGGGQRSVVGKCRVTAGMLEQHGIVG